MKNLYIHMGGPKTGSTAIQYFFRNFHQHIEDQFHIHRVQTGLRWGINSIDLFPIADDTLQALSDESAKHVHNDLVCSCELIPLQFFSNRNKEDIAQDIDKIRIFVKTHNLKFIFYQRRLDDLVKSWYNQDLKWINYISSTWETMTSADREFYKWIDNIHNLDYDNHTRAILSRFAISNNGLSILKEHCGNDNVIVRIFDRMKLKNGNIVDDFFDILGVDISSSNLPTHVDSNPKISDSSLPFLHEIYRHHAQLKKSQKAFLGDKVLFHYGLKQNAAIDDTIDSTEIDSLIRNFDELAPGYQELFDERPWSLNFPELDADPRDRITFDMLCTLYSQNASLATKLEEIASGNRTNAEDTRNAIAVQEIASGNRAHTENTRNAIAAGTSSIEVRLAEINAKLDSFARLKLDFFPNMLQAFILKIYRVYCRRFCGGESFRLFEKSRREYVARNNRLRRFLKKFGPVPHAIDENKN